MPPPSTPSTLDTENKATFVRTPATMIGFRWSDMASSKGDIYRVVSVWQEHASVYLSLAICVANQAAREAKAGAVADFATAAKTGLCAAGLCDAALQVLEREASTAPASLDLTGGGFLRALKVHADSIFTL